MQVIIQHLKFKLKACLKRPPNNAMNTNVLEVWFMIDELTISNAFHATLSSTILNHDLLIQQKHCNMSKESLVNMEGCGL
jgi:hypothetical protein